MSTANLLRKLGIYVVEDFFLADECLSFCEQMLSSEKTKAATYSEKAKQERFDENIRKTSYCDVLNASNVAIISRIQGIKPQLETFFKTQLSDSFERPKYLHYSEGDFFSPHTDDQLNRKINITINLNSQGKDSSGNGYEGGALQLYGLMKHKGFANRGIAAPTTAGCLIAYPVDIVHEVTPITYGARFSIVSRYLAK